MTRILVVNTEADRAQALAANLGLSGHEARASTTELVLVARALDESSPEVVVIDASPEPQLRELVAFIQKRSDAEMIVLVDNVDEDDLVQYLDRGVTYYLGKPISVRVLSARAKALSDRVKEPPGASVQRQGTDWELDPESLTVRHLGSLVQLSKREFRLFFELFKNRGQPVGQKQLLEAVWGTEFRDHPQYLRIYIGLLRRKLETNPRKPILILTVWGHGYRLAEYQSAPARKSVGRRKSAEQ